MSIIPISFLVALTLALWSEGDASEYKINGHLEKADQQEIETAIARLTKRDRSRIINMTVEKRGIVSVTVGRHADNIPILLSAQIYRVERQNGKWTVVRVRYLVI